MTDQSAFADTAEPAHVTPKLGNIIASGRTSGEGLHGLLGAGASIG